MQQEVRDRFDAKTVPLVQVSQGVEASAGTGKTYSIALLALRLVLEKKIPVSSILMVTFTRAAVAELELRVRAFIRSALEFARDPEKKEGDSNIQELVKLQIKNTSSEEVQETLAHALLLLDETAVLTIHSFCQRVLKEFSFETMQAFGTELLSEENYHILLEDHFNEYWRTKIATLDPKILLTFFRKQSVPNEEKNSTFSLNRELILELVRKGLNGKKPYLEEKLPSDFLQISHQHRIRSVIETTEAARQALCEAIIQHQQELLRLIEKNRYAVKSLPVFFETRDWVGLVETLWSEQDKKYIREIFNLVGEARSQYFNLRSGLEKNVRIIAHQLAADICSMISTKIGAEKDQKLSKTFDDLIVQVRKAVLEGPQAKLLKEKLRKQFRAVFIDEFQDTDNDQYQIFSTLFGDDHFLFFIGDPKQSIYGWRKADIHAYFRALESVAIRHKMNVNFRSNRRMIEAMNYFFMPAPGFDTFKFEKVVYHPAESPTSNTKGELVGHDQSIPPILVSRHQNADDRIDAVARLISQLVWSSEYKIFKEGKPERVRFSDIGILVRSKDKGRKIKQRLSAARIPAVTVDDARILSSPEAKELYYILSGIYELTRQKINRAMLTSIAGYTSARLAETDEEGIVARFRLYQESWKSRGVYVMLQQFLADHEVHRRFYESAQSNAERIVANMLQLVDLLHRIAVRRQFDMSEQLQWLKKAIEGDVLEGDEYVQRIESDEEAVRIVTIHRAKGLEYPIILCPELDFKVSAPSGSAEFQLPDGSYMVAEKSSLKENNTNHQLFTLQQEQENRRLLYVAITRACQQCFLLTGMPPKEDKTDVNTLDEFLRALDLENVTSNLIQLWNVPEKLLSPHIEVNQSSAARYLEPRYFELREKNWRRASFTKLTPEHTPVPIPISKNDAVSAYDQFVFRKLRKGAVTGNLLHAIFERINFANSYGWEDVIRRMVRRFQVRSSAQAQDSNDFEIQLRELVQEVLHTSIFPDAAFRLADLDRKDRLTELEFDLDLKSFRVADLQKLASPEAPFRVHLSDEDGIGSRSELEGIMNGLMDLFFEWQGKFYILDWKSNYLGDRVEDYGAEQVGRAMAENNYHLQYHLYTVAACRYLRTRMPSFDYEQHFGGVIYLFVRGIRQGRREGVFYSRPQLKVIEGMNALFNGIKVVI